MDDYEEQCERIKSVFSLAEVPDVIYKNTVKYLNFLRNRLTYPCRLTGIESMGYFAWEERFDFGYGTEAEYEKLQKKRGSYHDEYELKNLSDAVVEKDGDIIVEVRRVYDQKKFKIPLSELQSLDESSDNYQLLNDFTVWYVNWI